jgi:hypothetical protein
MRPDEQEAGRFKRFGPEQKEFKSSTLTNSATSYAGRSVRKSLKFDVVPNRFLQKYNSGY